MRLLRAVVAALALAVIAVSDVAFAAGAPSAPFDAYIVDGRDTDNHGGETAVLDNNNGSVYFRASPGGYDNEMLYIEANRSDNGGYTMFTHITSPHGTKVTPGVYPTDRLGAATKYGVSFADCTGAGGGTLTIHSVIRDAGGAITSFAASYVAVGGTCVPAWTAAELRWHSAVDYAAAKQSQRWLDLPGAGLGHQTVAQTITFTGAGSIPLKFGTPYFEGAGAGEFAVVSDTCSNTELAYNQVCTIGVVGRPQTVGRHMATLKIPDNSAAGFHGAHVESAGGVTAAGTYFPVRPERLLDTRIGFGSLKKPLGPRQFLTFQVGTVGGVPATGVAAVVLNVTATGSTAGSFLTVYPTGTSRPTASNLNFPPGWTGANAVTVPVGTGGKVDIYNEAGSVHVLADVAGFYLADDTMYYGLGGQLQPHETVRLLDTRTDSPTAVPGKYAVHVGADYGPAVNPHVRALAVNITAVTPTGHGYLTAWDGFVDPPLASVLNFTPGSVVPNFAIVPTRPCTSDPGCAGVPEIVILNGSTGATHILVDVVGFYDDAQIGPGLRYHPMNPTRVTDSRTGLGTTGAIGAGSTRTIIAPAAVAGPDTWALITNVTGVNLGNGTYLTLWPAGSQRPTASNLNLTAGEVRPNAAIVPLGPGNTYNVYSAASSVHVIIDVAGRFDLYPYWSVPQPASTAANAGARTFTPRAVPGASFVAW